ncbi:putative hydrolase [Reticulomyxa filosa]|uniref:Putative hydrolase n=1 Tax=Reticulomyxa filosa TaxID=46433 RepID=X6NCV7_RETFI|nr:putative hydrolase [Reticulomyxa filosa]|eukprot:ETO23157.1 putative hydrolase [Reticulomyxa filosa]
MKVAVAQISAIPGKIDENVAKLARYAKEAASNSADMLITPELFLTGYDVEPLSVIASLAQPLVNDTNETIDKVKKIAKENGIAIVTGLPIGEKGQTKAYNSIIWIDKTGKLADVYHKTHLWGESEKSVFISSSNAYHITPFNVLNEIKIGLLVCFDVEFPEPSRILAVQGAQMIISIAACVSMKHMWSLLQTRALENHCHVIYCNFPNNNVVQKQFGGESIVIAPDGSILNHCDAKLDGLIYADIDPSKDSYRSSIQRNDYLVNRKPHLYSEILDTYTRSKL